MAQCMRAFNLLIPSLTDPLTPPECSDDGPIPEPLDPPMWLIRACCPGVLLAVPGAAKHLLQLHHLVVGALLFCDDFLLDVLVLVSVGVGVVGPSSSKPYGSLALVRVSRSAANP